MTRQELRVLQGEWFCGCGMPEEASRALLRLLRLHPLYENQDELQEWIPDDGVRYLLLYQLDRLELTEHGGSVGGAWLTDKGKAALEALAREEADGFEALCEPSCIHGFTFDEDHDCMAADAELARRKGGEG